MDKVIPDEMVGELASVDEVKFTDEGSFSSVETRVDELEKAVGVLMGFVKTVLPTDFQRYLRNELRLAKRPESKKELRV